jgi:mannose/cellobiose epimerase-like protein (N-acyl-D-glucosamine 2-epimerase family)
MPKKITSKAQARWAFAHAKEKGWSEEEIANAIDNAGGMKKLPEKVRQPKARGGTATKPKPRPASKVSRKRKAK